MPVQKANFIMSQLYGNRMAVANLELRMPLVGPSRLGLIKSRYFYTELTGFPDAGMTWNDGGYFSFNYYDLPPPKPGSSPFHSAIPSAMRQHF